MLNYQRVHLFLTRQYESGAKLGYRADVWLVVLRFEISIWANMDIFGWWFPWHCCFMLFFHRNSFFLHELRKDQSAWILEFWIESSDLVFDLDETERAVSTVFMGHLQLHQLIMVHHHFPCSNCRWPKNNKYPPHFPIQLYITVYLEDSVIQWYINIYQWYSYPPLKIWNDALGGNSPKMV